MSQIRYSLHQALVQLRDTVEHVEPGQEPGVLDLLTQLNDALKTHQNPQDLVVLQASDSMTTTQVSALIGVSLPTLRRMVERGEIQGHKVGKHLRFLAQDVAAYQQARREQEQALDELCAMSMELEP